MDTFSLFYMYVRMYISALVGPAFIRPSIENATCNTAMLNCLSYQHFGIWLYSFPIIECMYICTYTVCMYIIACTGYTYSSYVAVVRI